MPLVAGRLGRPRYSRKRHGFSSRIPLILRSDGSARLVRSASGTRDTHILDQAFIIGLLSGATAGALLTGIFDLISRGSERTQEKRDLRVGLAAEIRVGLQNVDPKSRIDQTPEQSLHFIAGNCFPYKFFDANQSRIGLLPADAASDVVEYHALLWQFYEKAKILNKWAESGDDREELLAEIKTIMGRIHDVGKRALADLRQPH